MVANDHAAPTHSIIPKIQIIIKKPDFMVGLKYALTSLLCQSYRDE